MLPGGGGGAGVARLLGSGGRGGGGGGGGSPLPPRPRHDLLNPLLQELATIKIFVQQFIVLIIFDDFSERIPYRQMG
jgi:hypothetical protein